MRHPELGGPALVPASSLQLHLAQGWLRVSDAIAEEDMHRVDPAAYADAPDLDAVVDISTFAEPDAVLTADGVTATKPAKEK